MIYEHFYIMDDKEKGNLAIGKAQEPQEEASQPLTQDMPPQNKEKTQSVAFAENEYPDSQTSNTYKSVLSQPAPGLTQLQKLLWLQNKRTEGLWAQCDECDRWRYLPKVLDRHELPRKWFCWLNPDTSLAKCSVDETPIHLHDEEDLIHNEYAAGSLVLVNLPGWPWWPAMVDDCPDTEQFYWLDGFSDIPTHYNVVFFDQLEVTRAWIDPTHLKPYSKHKNMLKTSLRSKAYRKRIEIAISQADNAETLSLMERLKKYSFICRYKGPILNPKNITQKFHQKYRKQFKRKYNIDLPNDISDSDDEGNTEVKENVNKNVITVGSKRSKINEQNNAKSKANGFIDKDSALVDQVDVESAMEEYFTNGTCSTNVPDTNEQTNTIQDTQNIENRRPSTASDDFDF